MKKYLHIILFYILIPTVFNAQYYNRNTYKTKRHEINFGIGGSSCLTDLGGGEAPKNSLFTGNIFGDQPIARSFLFDLNIQTTNFAASFSYLYYLKSRIALRLNLTYGKVSGDDSYSGDFFRRNRALNFNTTIIEGSGIIEFTLVPEKAGNKYNLKNKYGKSIGAKSSIAFGLYIFAGLGGFYYDPWGTNKFLNSDTVNVGDGQKYRLRELHTEGQGFEGGPEMFTEEVTGKKYSTYKNFAICIPFGFGIKKAFHSTAGVKLEASYRFTNTDYIDDVSTFYYDKDKLRDEMTIYAGAELAQNAYTMSGTQTGAEYLYIGYAPFDENGIPVYPTNSIPASDLDGTNPYRQIRTRTEAGNERGGPNYNDSYMFLTFTIYKKLTNTPKTMRIANSGSKRKIKASF